MIVIMIGLPGSGKSFHAKRLIAEHLSDTSSGPRQAAIVSADDFFLDRHGVYRYDAGKIGDAQSACFESFLRHASTFDSKRDLVVVDNTNMTNWERTPYFMVGQALKHAVRFVQVRRDILTCISANTHGVPAEAILWKWKTSEPPLPWWNVEVIDNP